MVDDAVLTLGIWVENRLNETDGKGNPIYSLEELLADELTFDNEASIQQLEGVAGFLRRRKGKTTSELQVDGQSE